MKRLLFLKQIDLAGQILMLTPLLWFFKARPETTPWLAFMMLGAWQCISCLATVLQRAYPASHSRKLYNRTLLWVLSICAITFLLGSLFSLSDAPAMEDAADIMGRLAYGEAILMMFGGTFMAIWYFILTLSEIRRFRQLLLNS